MAATALGNLLATGVIGVSADGGFPGVFYATECTPAAPAWSEANDSALPSVAAPTGFASLRSVDGGAFARGLCFGDASPSKCSRCLSDVAKRVADDCATSRRPAVWTDGCFVHLADTNASSPDEETYHYGILEVVAAGDSSSSSSAAGDAAFVSALASRMAPRAANDTSRLLATATEDVPRAGGGERATATVHALAQCMPDRPAGGGVRPVPAGVGARADKMLLGKRNGGHEGRCRHGQLVIPVPTMSIGGFIRKMFTHHFALAISFTIALLVLVIGICFIIALSRSENRIPSAMQAEASPAGHFRGSGAAVKAAQTVVTPNTNQRPAAV